MSRLANGETVVNLATESGWSERTMRRTLHSIYLKLGAGNRAEAIAKAGKMGLLE